MRLALVLLFALPAAADLDANLRAKLEKEFAKKVAWEHDFEAAKRRAREEGKVVFAYFTRSYAP